MKTKKEIKNFYSFENYKPNKNAVAIDYKGKHYLSKAQCMALEGITRKELDAYLKGESTQNSELKITNNLTDTDNEL